MNPPADRERPALSEAEKHQATLKALYLQDGKTWFEHDDRIAILAAIESLSPKPALTQGGRELLCEDCAGEYTIWYADNDLWNAVMRGPGSAYDTGAGEPFLCARCFLIRAHDVTEHGRVTWPEHPSRRDRERGLTQGGVVERVLKHAFMTAWDAGHAAGMWSDDKAEDAWQRSLALLPATALERLAGERGGEADDRGVVGVILDALWPILGGNHMPAETWHEIADAARAAAPQPLPVEVEREEGLTDVFGRPFDGDDDPRLKVAEVVTRAEADAILEYRGDLVAILTAHPALGGGGR